MTEHGEGCTCRAHPLPDSLCVRDARAAYLAENGFTVAGYDEPWTEASFFGLRFSVPNTTKHRFAIRMHDLHHVATGYGTDLAGEAEVSAWEARRGFRNLGLYVSAIVAGLVAFGAVYAPRRTLRAFRSPGRRSLFAGDLAYDPLLELNVGELRALLGVPPGGLARARALHENAK